jgi:hypothetical protein
MNWVKPGAKTSFGISYYLQISVAFELLNQLGIQQLFRQEMMEG